jgi:periplasmic protein TonB
VVDLSQAIVGSDPGEVSRARQLRYRALVTSLLSETAIVACLLLWPLVKTAVLPLERPPAPIPVFHRMPPSNPPRVRQLERAMPDQVRALPNAEALHQPPRVPLHVDLNIVDSEPPVLSDLRTSYGVGPAIVGDGAQATNLVPPDAKPRSNAPVVMSTGVMAARLIHGVQPQYPRPALMIHLAGTVELRAIIATDGSVRNLAVVSGNPMLAAAAIEAVRQWRYQPTQLSGKPVEVETLITIQFQIE